MAKPDTWMPFYVGDYLRDTMHLSTAEHGVYIRLILAYWVRGKPLQDDDSQFANMMHISRGEWRRKYRERMAYFFKLEGGFWHHKRIEHELSKAKNISQVKSEAGLKGNIARWGKKSQPHHSHIANTSHMGSHMGSQTLSQTHPPSPPPTGGQGTPAQKGGSPPLPAFNSNSAPLMTKEELNAIRQRKFDAEAAAFAANQRPDAPD